MTEEFVVRTAQPQDEEGIMSLCRLMHAEIGLLTFNEAKTLHRIRRAWLGDDVIIGVIGELGKPVGCVALALTESWYSNDPIMGDIMVFVHPEHRRSNYARALLKYTKKVCIELGVPLNIGIMAGNVDNDRTLKTRLRYYRQEFGDPAGFSFLFNHKPRAASIEGAP